MQQNVEYSSVQNNLKYFITPTNNFYTTK